VVHYESTFHPSQEEGDEFFPPLRSNPIEAEMIHENPTDSSSLAVTVALSHWQ